MDFSGVRIGPQLLSDGVSQSFARGTREGAEVAQNLNGFYEEANLRGQIFSLVMPLTTGNVVAAGNIVAGAAGATTQFALINPANSGKNLVLLEFAYAISVATTAQMPYGPVFHGAQIGAASVAAAGTILSNIMGGGATSVAKPFVSAGAGAALTGGGANITVKLANFATTNTTQASPYLVSAIEYLDGKLVVAPNGAWLPLFNVAGSVNFAYGVSITWREAPV